MNNYHDVYNWIAGDRFSKKEINERMKKGIRKSRRNYIEIETKNKKKKMNWIHLNLVALFRSFFIRHLIHDIPNIFLSFFAYPSATTHQQLKTNYLVYRNIDELLYSLTKNSFYRLHFSLNYGNKALKFHSTIYICFLFFFPSSSLVCKLIQI